MIQPFPIVLFPSDVAHIMNGTVPFNAPDSSALAVESGMPTSETLDVEGGGMNYVVLFLPFVIAWGLSAAPVMSYFVAWAGSFMILLLTITGRIRPLPGDRSILDQAMRPIVLTQLIFVGYNFVSSIFYFADIHGYYYLSKVSTAPVSETLVGVTAQAQRYYVLAHAAVATGMLMAMDYRRSGEWVVRKADNPATFPLVVSGLAFGLATLFGSGLGQIGERLSQLGLVASVLALALAIPMRQGGVLAIASVIYGLNLMNAFLSGFKENVLVMVILLAVFAYPYARKTVMLGAPIVLVFLLAILPTFANVFRSLNWNGTASQEEAAAAAFDTIQSGDEDMAATNWAFLSGRISEIGLFNIYISSMELTDGFYGTTIIRQAVSSLVPRVFWSSKPVTETLVMQRVYENGVVSELSTVSAKPQYVVDGYLSFGVLGMLAGGLVFGLVAGYASRVCERFFGGYFWGTGLVYTSFFSVLWKGNSYEYFLNTIVWSLVLLIPLFYAGKWTGVLVRKGSEDSAPSVGQVARVRGVWAPR